MHRALIFNGAFVTAVSLSVFVIRGKQVRKELDEKMQRCSRQVELPLQTVLLIREDNEKTV
jgi:hypothetical protein